MQVVQALAAAKGMESPSLIENHSQCAGNVREDDCGVGQRLSAEASFTDAEREVAIKRCGQAVEKHMRRRMELQRSDCFADQGEADKNFLMAQEAARLMAELIRGRRPEYVARLEAERGLA